MSTSALTTTVQAGTERGAGLRFGLCALGFVVAAAFIFLFGVWALYKAVAMRRGVPIDDGPRSGADPSA